MTRSGWRRPFRRRPRRRRRARWCCSRPPAPARRQAAATAGEPLMAKKLAFDKVLFTTVLLLVGSGLVMVYSASAAIARESGARWNPFLLKQGLAAIVGIGAMLLVMHLDYR